MNILQDWINKLDNCNIDPQARKEIIEACTFWYDVKAKKKVYVVVGIWRGVHDKTKVFKTLEEALKFKAEALKDYDIDADKWDDEDSENMDYDVSIIEEEIS
jgi:hypothetical protein